ncbi:hypothetical protein EDC50_1866 [Vulcaniibacterium tengchongense]|uniref:Uncharacterized protein n=1 Tax=Vulcaniibacterium tengchongense TaxID=1273429 RepID=A0A3N4VEV2_9GAMM|nr:hypothetical protein EDC50_1866 [Vulcaniibacterium tengchongense]
MPGFASGAARRGRCGAPVTLASARGYGMRGRAAAPTRRNSCVIHAPRPQPPRAVAALRTYGPEASGIHSPFLTFSHPNSPEISFPPGKGRLQSHFIATSATKALIAQTRRLTSAETSGDARTAMAELGAPHLRGEWRRRDGRYRRGRGAGRPCPLRRHDAEARRLAGFSPHRRGVSRRPGEVSSPSWAERRSARLRRRRKAGCDDRHARPGHGAPPVEPRAALRFASVHGGSRLRPRSTALHGRAPSIHAAHRRPAMRRVRDDRTVPPRARRCRPAAGTRPAAAARGGFAGRAGSAGWRAAPPGARHRCRGGAMRRRGRPRPRTSAAMPAGAP